MHQLFCLILLLNFAGFAVGVSDLLASRTYCGYQRSDEYNRDNDFISIDEFPWIVQFVYNGSRPIKCTGSLINYRYVLTAAHCFADDIYYIKAVRLGDFNVTTDEDCVKHSRYDEECSDPVQEYGIEERISHPGYSPRIGFNDIALVRLTSNVAFTDYVRPICLPLPTDPKLVENDDLAVSGWGSWGYRGEITTLKKKVLAKFVPYETCKEAYRNTRYPLTEYHLCAIEPEDHTCRGDNGGPLMIVRRNQWIQVGVLTFRRTCNGKFPVGYINTTHYLEWIQENMRA